MERKRQQGAMGMEMKIFVMCLSDKSKAELEIFLEKAEKMSDAEVDQCLAAGEFVLVSLGGNHSGECGLRLALTNRAFRLAQACVLCRIPDSFRELILGVGMSFSRGNAHTFIIITTRNLLSAAGRVAQHHERLVPSS